MEQLLDGTGLAQQLQSKAEEALVSLDKRPKLVVILVGDDFASEKYVAKKQKTCESVGIDCVVKRYSNTIDEAALLNEIVGLNKDETVTGILIQLPLPEHIHARNILDAVALEKDVDGLTSESLGKLLAGDETGFISCTAKGIITLLEENDVAFEGKHVVIVGHSFLVGRPLSQLFLNRGATVTICHDKTIHLANHTKNADILVSATGVPHLITGDMVKKGAVVVDVGVAKLAGKMVGDVDFENVMQIASKITPVPGGVGPMTIAMLIENILRNR